MRLTIPGRPVPAVRMTQRSKYMSKPALRYLAYKDRIGWEAKAAKFEPVKHRVNVVAKAYLIGGGHEPDVDNLGKAFLDGLNKIAWEDDKQVMKLTVEKSFVRHKNEERAEIWIEEVS